MKKNKVLLLSIAFLVCLPLVGCDYTSSQDVSSTASSSSSKEEQAFYNRVIMDYYEQRIEQDNTLNMYLYNFNKFASARSIDEICVYDLLKSNESGAHILNISAYNLPSFAGNVFYYAFDGKTYEYINETPPDVYCNGKFYYLTDAYFMGIVSKNDILSAFDIALNDETLINRTFVYESDIKVKEKAFDHETFSNTLFHSFAKELQTAFASDAVLKDRDVDENSIHVYQHFSECKGCFCVNFSIDKIEKSRYLFEPMIKAWEDPLILEGKTIEPFRNTLPVVWANDAFHLIDEAISSKIIDEKTALELLDKCKVAATHDNGHLIGY